MGYKHYNADNLYNFEWFIQNQTMSFEAAEHIRSYIDATREIQMDDHSRICNLQRQVKALEKEIAGLRQTGEGI